ncbi:hypothetical protein [Desulfonema magnum]|uniref:Periplasmic heavy metal sensor n=1 Tax=Desulfonema magnum TaxID=45655 RepID=A0A975BRX5_9BACT|nr:hypothetical protein [Desulfonema magnum]QTA90470.1 Uncharacterized protein dnm_065310 [Desulfonema magnum]
MKMNKIKIIAGVVFVFFLGGVIGSVGTGIYIRHRIEAFAKGGGPLGKRVLAMKKLSAELDLTPSQRLEIEKIVDNTLTRLHEFRRKHHPELEKIFDHAVLAIKKHLNDEQKQKMDELSEKLKKRWCRKKFRHRP